MARALLVMVLVLLVAAPAATAGTRADIIADCYDNGRLDGDYSPSQIRDARNNLPADIDQYSDCRDVLSRALGGSGSKGVDNSGGAGGGGGGTPSAPAAPPTADEQKALESAAGTGGDAPVQVGAGTIVPGASGFSAGATHADLPPSLIVALILLGLIALAMAVPSARKRVLARRNA
jgi:hypothetical protein